MELSILSSGSRLKKFLHHHTKSCIWICLLPAYSSTSNYAVFRKKVFTKIWRMADSFHQMQYVIWHCIISDTANKLFLVPPYLNSLGLCTATCWCGCINFINCCFIPEWLLFCLFVSMSKGKKRGKLLQTSSIFIVKKTAQVNINSINKKKFLDLNILFFNISR